MLSEIKINEMLKSIDKKIEEGYQTFCWYAVRATLKGVLEIDPTSDIMLMEAAANTEVEKEAKIFDKECALTEEKLKIHIRVPLVGKWIPQEDDCEYIGGELTEKELDAMAKEMEEDGYRWTYPN